MLDYRLLEALHAVVREGGFEKAARALFITQSAVSQRIRLLEDQAGRVLLRRTAPPLPTPAGQRMLKHFLQVRQLEDGLGEDLSPDAGARRTALPIGLNADSLAIWFLAAMGPFLRENRVLLDLRVDDQEQTHRFLRDGEVMGCVTARERPMQGCRAARLGAMPYRLCATPEFAREWFPGGVTKDAIAAAPAVLFNRRDEMHDQMLEQLFQETPPAYPAHFVPSSWQFVVAIAAGYGYGMVPLPQGSELLASGRLVELDPRAAIDINLYWHCWNIRSRLMDRLTGSLTREAKRLLA